MEVVDEAFKDGDGFGRQFFDAYGSWIADPTQRNERPSARGRCVGLHRPLARTWDYAAWRYDSELCDLPVKFHQAAVKGWAVSVTP
jgi:hypothetical protein